MLRTEFSTFTIYLKSVTHVIYTELTVKTIIYNIYQIMKITSNLNGTRNILLDALTPNTQIYLFMPKLIKSHNKWISYCGDMAQSAYEHPLHWYL